jgi:hypothetical protein
VNVGAGDAARFDRTKRNFRKLTTVNVAARFTE